MEENVDISLAIELEDITLLECAFSVQAPIGERELERKLMISNPEKKFSLDVKRRKNILRAMVTVQFGLFDKNEKYPTGHPLSGEPLEIMHFEIAVGVVVSSPLMEGAAIAPRHMAGSQSPEATRDEKMERNMRVAAINSAYGTAANKLMEMSAQSVVGALMLPLIDTDELLDDISKPEQKED